MSSSFDPVPADRLEVTSEKGAALTDFDHRVMASILKSTHALRWPKDTISYLTERIGLAGFQIPVSQLSGFTQYAAQFAVTAGTGTTASSTYGNLSDGAGPTISGLANGKYLLLYGASAKSSDAAGEFVISPMLNATEASDNDLSVGGGLSESVLFGASLANLSSADNNSVTLRYRTGATASTATFRYRRVIAIKYAEL